MEKMVALSPWDTDTGPNSFTEFESELFYSEAELWFTPRVVRGLEMWARTITRMRPLMNGCYE